MDRNKTITRTHEHRQMRRKRHEHRPQQRIGCSVACVRNGRDADIKIREGVWQLHLGRIVEIAASKAAVLQVEQMQRRQMRQADRTAEVVVRQDENARRQLRESQRNVDGTTESIVGHAVDRGSYVCRQAARQLIVRQDDSLKSAQLRCVRDGPRQPAAGHVDDVEPGHAVPPVRRDGRVQWQAGEVEVEQLGQLPLWQRPAEIIVVQTQIAETWK